MQRSLGCLVRPPVCPLLSALCPLPSALCQWSVAGVCSVQCVECAHCCQCCHCCHCSKMACWQISQNITVYHSTAQIRCSGKIVRYLRVMVHCSRGTMQRRLRSCGALLCCAHALSAAIVPRNGPRCMRAGHHCLQPTKGGVPLSGDCPHCPQPHSPTKRSKGSQNF